MIKDAQNVDADDHLDGTGVDALYQHYAGYLGSNSAQGGAAEGAYDVTTGTAQADTQYAGRTEAGVGEAGMGTTDEITIFR